MRFYLGVHRPAWLAEAGVPLFVSHQSLRTVQKLPRAGARWALDSGAYTEVSKHGGWRTGAREYARAVARYRQDIGKMDWAAPQDWTCDPASIQATGLSVEKHQELTTRSYLELRSLGVPVIPVLQGWSTGDFWRHQEAYERAGVHLSRLPVVGLGSIARRQGGIGVSGIVATLAADGVKLHGFGVKKQGLLHYGQKLASADSMAWSFEATKAPPLPGHSHASCSNCLEYALRWREEVIAVMRRAGVPVENGERGASHKPETSGKIRKMSGQEMTVTNSAGVTFAVRVVRTGDKYGLGRQLTHSEKEPLIEFYDVAYKGKGFDPLGQFVARYYAETLASHPRHRGLDMVGHVPRWKIDAESLGPVIDLARSLRVETSAKAMGRRPRTINAEDLINEALRKIR